MEQKMDIPLIFKEDVIKNILDLKSKKVIYISSSTSNLEYYNKIIKRNNKEINSKFLELNSFSEVDLIGVNIELLKFFDNKDKSVCFIDLSLALRVFFDKYVKKTFLLNEEYDRELIVNFLLENGYEREYNVEKKGFFSIRGDIIDIYAPNLENPIRLDFFDGLLEEIKVFDVKNQLSFESLDEIEIYGNVLNGIQKGLFEILEDYKNDETKIIMENEEILEIKLSHILALDLENAETLEKRYAALKSKSQFLNVQKNVAMDYEKEILLEKRTYEKKGIKYSDVTKINVGDYVIHVEYGIGIFRDIVNINNKDYIYIQYADHDKLYVPVDQLNRISKYISTGKAPLLYSLGTRGYKKREKRIRENIEEYAKELVEIQALRLKSNKKAYDKDNVWQEEFEERFYFNLTPDQKNAITEIKRDLESGMLMDRLLVGDVGFGKTEIALRAAFKAVQNGDQCVILAPTTVLVNQHYIRCKERFEEFGIRVENLSRLTGSRTSEVLRDIANGRVDIIIATHKILSDKVSFKNLGMLIIDEEQKFGVKAKEKLKKLKSEIHLLSLSATPIPRTLNLALLGIRDISIIESSPIDRLPIITKRINENEVKKAILDEILRDGQVFYITNNVKGMERKKEELKKLLPKFINVEYINGQISPTRIKNIIGDFESGKFEILIASTIIENGIDISNANTIIIENYDKLGLSQIYQLRGRVGRSKRQGYCYLIEKEFKRDKARKKDESLYKIEGVSGGGYILSLEDLDIRGAGEILGEKQHGAIDIFGYDLYVKMLKEAMRDIKGEKNHKGKNISINLKENGSIPEEYIKNEERLLIYKRYSEITTYDELEYLNLEIRDRFGKIPSKMLKFMEFMHYKIWAFENEVYEINEKENIIEYKKDEKTFKIPKEKFRKMIKLN